MTRCVHDFQPGQCALCAGHEPPAIPTVGYPFVAGYPGPCEACDDPIRPGDRIVRADGGGYVHTECL